VKRNRVIFRLFPAFSESSAEPGHLEKWGRTALHQWRASADRDGTAAVPG
jgi:hypothetical protein